MSISMEALAMAGVDYLEYGLDVDEWERRELESPPSYLLLDNEEKEEAPPPYLLLDEEEEEAPPPYLLLDDEEKEEAPPPYLLLDEEEKEEAPPPYLPLDDEEKEKAPPSYLLLDEEEDEEGKEFKRELRNSFPSLDFSQNLQKKHSFYFSDNRNSENDDDDGDHNSNNEDTNDHVNLCVSGSNKDKKKVMPRRFRSLKGGIVMIRAIIRLMMNLDTNISKTYKISPLP